MTIVLSEYLNNKIPGPAPAPFLGWLPLLIRFALDPLASLESMRQQYGNILRLGIKNYPVIMIFHPDLNRQILRDPSSFTVTTWTCFLFLFLKRARSLARRWACRS